MIPVDALTGILMVTGTDTDVGKTVATAALAAAAARAGRTVAVFKPAQTGVSGDEPGDIATITALADDAIATAVEGCRLPEPLAPTTAARRAGLRIPTVDDHAVHIAELAATHNLVLVEGAGGVMVGLDGAGSTLLDVADACVASPPQWVVVTRPGLGTLNHTQLTVEAIRQRDHHVAGLILGTWPAHPDVAALCNRDELPQLCAAPLWGVLDDGIPSQPHRVRGAFTIQGEQ